jgi:hypothetical protein
VVWLRNDDRYDAACIAEFAGIEETEICDNRGNGREEVKLLGNAKDE